MQRTQQEATRHPVTSGPVVRKLLSEAECCAPLLVKILLFSSVAEDFAEIHSRAKFVWNIVSMVVKMTARRKLLSHNIKELFDAMDDAYSFVSKANKLEWIKSNPKVIKDLSEHTAHCAQYIKEIAGSNSFGNTAPAGAIEAQIQNHIASFKGLRTSLQGPEQITIPVDEFVVRRHGGTCGLQLCGY